jgi:hypothetical protein
MNLPVSRAKADELEAVLSGRRSTSVASPLVRRLAETGRHVAETIRLPEPDEVWQAALRNQLLTTPIELPAVPRWRALTTRIAASARVALATGTAGALIGSTGVVAAAAQSLPGDLLHPVKIATEQTRLLLSTTAAGDVDLHLAFARERLDEAESIAGSASSATLGAVMVNLDQHLAAAAADAAGDPDLMAVVTAELEDVARRLSELADLLPPGQRPFVDRSLAAIAALLGAPGLPPAGPGVEPTSGPTTGPGEETPTPGNGVGESPTTPVEPKPSISEPGLVPQLPGVLEGLGEQLEDVLDGLLEDLAPPSPTDAPDVPLVDEVEEQLDVDGLLSQD